MPTSFVIPKNEGSSGETENLPATEDPSFFGMTKATRSFFRMTEDVGMT